MPLASARSGPLGWLIKQTLGVTTKASTQAVVQTMAVTMLTVSLYRIDGLLQIVELVTVGDARYPMSPRLLAFTAVVLFQGIAVLGICAAKRRLPVSVITADLLLNMVELFVGAALIPSRYAQTWGYFMYPYTMICCIALGVTYRRFSTVLTATVALAGSYVAAAVILHHDPLWNAVPNAMSYFANTAVGWVISRYLQRNARRLDQAREQAVVDADALAQARERERHARLLHDRVLQTMETLARDGWVGDSRLQDQVAAEAMWLRALVEGEDLDKDDLVAKLQRLVQDKATSGLRVELNAADLTGSNRWRSRITSAAASALVDAAFEALTNVSKHSGVNSAVVHAAQSDGGLRLTVLDHGCGFDPSSVRCGVGLTRSIGSRLREVGGTSRVDGVPGGGTYVELTVPLTDPID